MTRLDQIKARLAAATPGPWKRDEIDSLAGPCRDEDHYESDRILIAHAPQDLRDLLELYDAIRKYANHHGFHLYHSTTGDKCSFAEQLEVILSRLDSPVGDEGAE